MPAKGPGFLRKNDKSPYGTDECVALLLWAFAEMTRIYPGTVPAVVGNLSAKEGGRLRPHKSHQSGRDVDLGYLHKVKLQPVTSMLSTDESNLDPKLTWALLEIFLSTNKVKAVFIDYKIQKVLYDYLVNKKYNKRKLEKIFQYPRGRGSEALIKHVKGHHHHIHMRFVCPAGDARCVE